MAVDTCRGKTTQSDKPKMLEDEKKVALIGGVIVQFAIGALRLYAREGGYSVNFGRLLFCCCPVQTKTFPP